VRTSEGRADSICQLVGVEQSVGFDHLAFAVDPLGLDRVEPRTLLGQQRQVTILTPEPLTLTSRLCLPIQRRTSRLMCQLALSQINTQTFLPMAANFSEHHSKKRLALMALTGRPSTKRSHVFSDSGT
jgi:hypothetical protein